MSDVVSVRLPENISRLLDIKAAQENTNKSALVADLLIKQLESPVLTLPESGEINSGALPPNLALLLVETCARLVQVQNHLRVDTSRLEATRQFLIRQYLK